MKTQRFGIEIEMTGLTRQEAAEVAAAQLWAENLDHVGGSYDAYHILNQQGRTWKVVSDSSIEAQKKYKGTGIV